MSKNAVRDEVMSSGGLTTASTSLLGLVGGWGNIGGPGMFMIRALTTGTVTALFMGMSGAIPAAIIYGTACLPFVVCSCIGFIVGTCGFYRDAIQKSLLYLNRYPRLLQIHLDANFPSEGFNNWPLEHMRSSSFKSWQLRSMLVVGWLSATPAIENLVDSDEQAAIRVNVASEERQ